MTLVCKVSCDNLTHKDRFRGTNKGLVNVDIFVDGTAFIYLANVEKHIKGGGLLNMEEEIFWWLLHL